MILPDGTPSVLEFNARFGDPETQVLLPALLPGFSEHLAAIAQRRWNPVAARQVLAAERASVTTVLPPPADPHTPVKRAALRLPAAAGPQDGALAVLPRTPHVHAGQLS